MLYDPYKNFKKNVLPNGLEVHSLHWNRPWILCKIIVHSGAKEDPAHLPGLAHFVEHVCNQNIPGWKHSSAVEFFESHGGYGSFGSTGYDSIEYEFKIPAKEEILTQALQIFGSLLLDTKIEKKIEHERNVIMQEFKNQYPDNKELQVQLDQKKKVFAGHRLENYTSPLGTEDSIATIAKEDLQNFYDTWYTPQNISIVFVGEINTRKLVSVLKKSPFNSSKKGLRNPLLQSQLNLPGTTGTKTIINRSHYLNSGSEQIGYNAEWVLPSSISVYALSIFNDMLNTLMFKNIRQKYASVYKIRPDYYHHGDVIRYWIHSEFTQHTGPDIEVLIEKCISSLLQNRTLCDEKICQYLKSFDMIDVSGHGILSKVANNLIDHQRIITLKESYANWQKVNLTNMQEIANYLTPERRHTLIYQP